MSNYPALSLNQFGMSPVEGQLDLLTNQNSVITGQVDAAQGTPLVAGQAVKMAPTAGGVPKFVALTSANDAIFGFVARNVKDSQFAAGAYFELAFVDAVMWKTASGAITRGGTVEYAIANNQIAASGGVNPAFGIALDTATGAGDLIRVLIKTPALSSAQQPDNTVNTVVTLAQINAGQVIIPAVAGKKITVTNFIARVNGNFAAGTAVLLQSTNVAPVIVATIAEAGLTNGNILLPPSANVTLGAGFGVPLGVGDGLQVANSGAPQTTGVNITFDVTYRQA